KRKYRPRGALWGGLRRPAPPGAPPPVRFDVVAFEAGRPHWLRGAFWLAEHAPAQGRRGQDAQGWRVR
ncbi:hypothetical protein QJT94_11710, partial [Bordetella bronchiseptica]